MMQPHHRSDATMYRMRCGMKLIDDEALVPRYKDRVFGRPHLDFRLLARSPT